MDIYFSLTGLLNAATSLGLGVFVFLKNPKSKTNQTFALFCLSVFVWAGAYIFWPLTQTKSDALLSFQVLHIGSIFISITYFHFVIAWLGLYKRKKKILILGYLLAFFFLCFVFTPFFIKDMTQKFSMRYWAEPGILYHFYLIMFFGFAIYSWYLLIKYYRKFTGIKKQQIKYILIGIIIGYIGGSTNYFLWYDINIPPYGNILGIAWVLFSAYAIIKYRLMNLRIILGKTAVYVFSFVTTIGVTLSLMFLNNQLPTPVSPYIAYSLILVVSILLFQFLFRFYEHLASKYFYYTFYSYQQVIKNLSQRLTKFLRLDKLTLLITETLMDTMKLDKAGILLKDREGGRYKIQKIIGFREENGISLVRDNFLTNYLQKTQKPLIYEEIDLTIRNTQNKKEKQRFKKLKKDMKKIEAALCLPLLREDKIMGIVVLGNKLSGEPYSKEDIELLTGLSTQASIALENAQLYNQVQDLSENLQEKVDEQTKELKQAFEKLKRLDEAKSEFISIASHQLRTPLTAIKGYLSMILEGRYGKLNKKMREKMKRVYKSGERLVNLVNTLLDISRIETGRIKLEEEKVQIEGLIEGIIDELKIQVDNKDLYLKFKKPKKKIPKIRIDKQRIREAILNIIDNGIRYTKKGGVTIKIKRLKEKLRVEVKDTGIGMTKKELNTVFIRFIRGETGPRLYTEGVGLGLYITKRLIELHQGKIWAESEGKGKGSTFYIELPIE